MMDKSKRGRYMPSTGLGEWQPLTNEEKTRHDALFFSQGPIEGLLPGEKARELFLRSNLPLQILSQIWQLVDVPHDNMLDAGEFQLAIHLIQSQLLGRPVPPELPDCFLPPPPGDELSPAPKPAPATSVVRLPQMTRREYTAYGRLFETLEVDRQGVLKVNDVRAVLLTSELPMEILASIWDVAEVDRDGRFNNDEFCIACHLCRLSKKGHTVTGGPINALALLPNKTPKTDLDAKKQKMKELYTRKRGLMALKEKRRIEAKREAKRVHLWRERLKLLTARLRVLREVEALTAEQDQQEEQNLDDIAEMLNRIKVVADRLKKEHEVVRQETARTIVEEQKLSEEVSALQEEADSLRKRRKRNSLIKDLDPFHQLYEDRKEEKLTGIAVQRKIHDVHIPFKHDPFEPADLWESDGDAEGNNDRGEKTIRQWLSGDEVFALPNNNNNSLLDNNNGGGGWSGGGGNGGATRGPWGQQVDPDIAELTQGFDDNFVEKWGQTTSPRMLNYPGLAASPSFLENTEADDFSFDEDLDPVFRTVSVMAAEDDLWISLPHEELAEQDKRLYYLENKISSVNDLIAEVNEEGPQLEFRHPGDYVVSPPHESPSLERQSKWDLLASRRRSTDAHTAAKSASSTLSVHRQPRSSSEPRRPRDQPRPRENRSSDDLTRDSDRDKDSRSSSSSSKYSPKRSNSERAKRRAANLPHLDPYPEERDIASEYDFRFPETDPDLDLEAELFFETKQQKYRKNKSAASGGNKSVLIKPTTEKLESPVQSLRRKKEKAASLSSNTSSRRSSIDTKDANKVTSDLPIQETPPLREDSENLSENSEKLLDDSQKPLKLLYNSQKSGNSRVDLVAEPDSTTTATTTTTATSSVSAIEPDRNVETTNAVSDEIKSIKDINVECEKDISIEQESLHEKFEESIKESIEEPIEEPIKELIEEPITKTVIDTVERTDSNTADPSCLITDDIVEKVVNPEQNFDELESQPVSKTELKSDEIKRTFEEKPDEIKRTSEEKPDETNSPVERENLESDSVVFRNKTSQQKDRQNKAQTWYQTSSSQPAEQTSNTTTTDLGTAPESIRVRSQEKEQVSREFRQQKALSWCATGPTPVPPPRRKSRSAIKTPPLEESVTESKSLKPNRSFLHSQSVDIPVGHKLTKFPPEIKQSLFPRSSSPIKTKPSSSSASSTASLSPLHSPKKRPAPKPPTPTGSASTSPLSSVPTSPVHRPIKAVHPSQSSEIFQQQTTKAESRSTLASTTSSSEGSRPTSPDLGKISLSSNSSSTAPTATTQRSFLGASEDPFPVPPPRTRSKRGRKGQPNLGDAKGHPLNKSVSGIDQDAVYENVLIKSHSLPAPDLVSDLSPVRRNSDTEEKTLLEEILTVVAASEEGRDTTIAFTSETLDSPNTSSKTVVDSEPIITAENTKVQQHQCEEEEEVKTEDNVDISLSNIDAKQPSAFQHDYVNFPPHQNIDRESEAIIVEYSTSSSTDVKESESNQKPNHDYVNVKELESDQNPSVSGEPYSYSRENSRHEYVNLPLIPPPPGSPKPIKSFEPHDYVNVDTFDSEELKGEGKDTEISDKEVARSEETDEQIYFSYDQIGGLEKPRHSSTSTSDSSEDIVNQRETSGGGADNIFKWMKSEDVVSQPSSSQKKAAKHEDIVSEQQQHSSTVEGPRGCIVTLGDGQTYEISTDYNNLTADDISLLVEHGFDYDIMDAAARKRELERLRAQFFKPKPSSPDTSPSSPTLIITNNNNNSSSDHSSALPTQVAKTVINIGGADDEVEDNESNKSLKYLVQDVDDEDAKVPSEGDMSSPSSKYITNHTTTINVTIDDDDDGDDKSKTETSPATTTAYQSPLDTAEEEFQVALKNENSVVVDGDNDKVKVAPANPSFTTLENTDLGNSPKSRIVLDLDAHQFVPEIETDTEDQPVATPAPQHIQSVQIESDPEEEEEIVIATTSTDPVNNKPGLVVVSDPFDPWNFSSGNKPGLFKEDSWDEDEPIDNKKESGFGDLTWDTENKDRKETVDNKTAEKEKEKEKEKERDRDREDSGSLLDLTLTEVKTDLVSKDIKDNKDKKDSIEKDKMAAKSPKLHHTFGSPIYTGDKPPRHTRRSSSKDESLFTPEKVSVTQNKPVQSPFDDDDPFGDVPMKTSNGVVTDFDQLASSAPLVHMDFEQRATSPQEGKSKGGNSSPSPPLPSTPPPMMVSNNQSSLFDLDPFFSSPSPSNNSNAPVTPSGQNQNYSTPATPSGESQKKQEGGGDITGITPATDFSAQFEVSWDKEKEKEKDKKDINTASSLPKDSYAIDSAFNQGARPKQIEKKATSPERKTTSPERKTTSPERKPTSPERKPTSPERKVASGKSEREISTTEESILYTPSSYIYTRAEKPEKSSAVSSAPLSITTTSQSSTNSKPPSFSPSSPTSPTPRAVTTTSIRLASPERRPLSPTADDLALLDAMDPVTGLRRTAIQDQTPMEKAMQFVGSTDPVEPTYQSLKLRLNDSPSDEIEKGRQEILGESRVLKKTVTSWTPQNEMTDPWNTTERGESDGHILESQKRYEERSRKRSKDLTSPTTDGKKPNFKAVNPADIDSRSLTEQKQQVKQQIEQNLASENARLFPTQQSPKSPQSPPISNSQNFRSSVDSESIGDLKATRQHLQRMVSAEDNKSPGGGGGGDSRDSKKGAESDIDRDIRDAIERDRIFRDEQKRRLQELQQQLQQQQQEKQDQSKREITTKQTMPIQKVQPVQKVQSPPAQKVQSPQAQKVQSSPMVQKVQPQPPSSVGSSWEMPEVDRDAARLKESIIDRELREQREREKEWAHEGHVKSPSNTYDDKEQEQSAFEHREKEEERAASESVIVREIRQQEEREQELRQLRQSITADPDPSTPEPVQQQSQQSPAPQQYTSPVSPSYNIPTTKPVERVTPSAPVQSRGGGQQQSNMPKPIGYEAAISTFAHAGENLIAKEIAEQKAKEDAVRQHWKEIGMEVPLSTQDPADTPFNRPEPQLSYKQRMGLVGMGGRGGGGGVQQQRGGTYQKEVKPYKAGAGQDNGGAGPRRGSLDSEDSSKASSGDRLDARHPPSTPKVQPFVMEDDDEDAIDNRRIFFQPQNETPVEREIRLARERDMALQLERGLPVNTDNTDGARHSPASEATQPRPRPSPAPSSNSPRVAGDDKHAMKRFASSRLQFEMEREKQRELQMQGEGKISTTSQDRKSGQVRYKDIISPDAPPPQPLTSSTTKPSFAITSEVRVLQNGSSPRLTGEPVKSEPPVNKRNQHLTQAQVAQVAQDGGSSLVESLIEQELRQQREREDELRRERQQAISGRVVPNGDSATSPAPSSPSPASSTATPPPKSQSMDAIAHREKQNGNDAALKTHRRKSALAEQWEKKFGAAPQ